MDYQTLYQASLDTPDEFWGDIASELVWTKPWEKVLDDSNAPFYEWFSGGELNTCYNALDRHCEQGRAQQAALIYDSPVTGQVRTYSYAELRDEVAVFANVLQKNGVAKGDRVIVYMPMIPEAVISMLACARIGAIHSVVFGGFAAKELATRVIDASPKLVISASCGIEGKKVIPYLPLLDEALELAGAENLTRILVSRPQLPIEDLHPIGGHLGGCCGRGPCSGLRTGGRKRPALYSLHLRHHGGAQGGRASQRRACCCTQLDHETHLQCAAG